MQSNASCKEKQGLLLYSNTVSYLAMDCKVIACWQDGSTTSHAMEVKGMWPYWKEGTETTTVRNDVNLDRIVMLTGACT